MARLSSRVTFATLKLPGIVLSVYYPSMLSEVDAEAAIQAINEELAKVQRGEVTASEQAVAYLKGAQHALEAMIGQAEMPDPVMLTRVL